MGLLRRIKEKSASPYIFPSPVTGAPPPSLYFPWQRIRVRAGDVTQQRIVQSGSSYLSQEDKRQHFGLGAATSIDSIEVTWPDGTRARLENVKANQVVRTAPVLNGKEPSVPVTAKNPLNVTMQVDSHNGMKTIIKTDPNLKAPVQAGGGASRSAAW